MADNKFSKEVDYSLNQNDFVLDNEITVTITLHEYRELVENNATSKVRIDEANNEKWKYYRENEELKKQVAELKDRIVSTVNTKVNEVTISYESTCD